MRHGHIFSIGGQIARVWKPTPTLLPWALSSALLVVAALWDFWSVGARPDLVVMGLAAYEMMIGLLETAPAGRPASRETSAPLAPAGTARDEASNRR